VQSWSDSTSIRSLFPWKRAAIAALFSLAQQTGAVGNGAFAPEEPTVSGTHHQAASVWLAENARP
jgi:hypothetical protein